MALTTITLLSRALNSLPDSQGFAAADAGAVPRREVFLFFYQVGGHKSRIFPLFPHPVNFIFVLAALSGYLDTFFDDILVSRKQWYRGRPD